MPWRSWLRYRCSKSTSAGSRTFAKNIFRNRSHLASGSYFTGIVSEIKLLGSWQENRLESRLSTPFEKARSLGSEEGSGSSKSLAVSSTLFSRPLFLKNRKESNLKEAGKCCAAKLRFARSWLSKVASETGS